MEKILVILFFMKMKLMSLRKQSKKNYLKSLLVIKMSIKIKKKNNFNYKQFKKKYKKTNKKLTKKPNKQLNAKQPLLKIKLYKMRNRY